MNTLHLCHWLGRKRFKSYLALITEQDSLLIYGAVTALEKTWITQELLGFENPWYLVNNTINPNLTDNEIDTDQWLKLIIQHKNTLAWK